MDFDFLEQLLVTATNPKDTEESRARARLYVCELFVGSRNRIYVDEGMKLVRKRFQHTKNPAVAQEALEVVDALMKVSPITCIVQAPLSLSDFP